MEFKDFSLHASVHLCDAYCRKCQGKLVEVPDGWFSKGLFCPHCEIVYTIKLVQVPSKRVDKRWLKSVKEKLKRDR